MHACKRNYIPAGGNNNLLWPTDLLHCYVRICKSDHSLTSQMLNKATVTHAHSL